MPGGGIESQIQLYDSDILRCEKVLARLNEWSMKRRDLEDFRQEAIGRFAEIGLVVTVLAFETDQPDVYAFDIQIEGRTESHEFDPDRMVHEVTEDILDLLPASEKGQTIKAKGEIEKHQKH